MFTYASIIPRIALVALATLAASCSTGRYSCPAPNGVTCMSATQIYDATDSQERVVGNAHGKPVEDLAATARDDGPYAMPADMPAPRARHRAARNAVVVDRGSLAFADEPEARAAYPVAEMPEAVPVRTPAKVMRIWVAPWQDKTGDLHMAGHVFTEIEPRRWSVGEPSDMGAPRLELLQPLNPSTSARASEPSAAKPPVNAERGG